jgi:hypothetical protein
LSEAGEAVRTDAGTDPGSDSAVDSGPVDSGPVDSGPADSGPVVVVDSGPVVVDSGPVAVDTGVQTDTGVAGDAGRPTCGRWVASDKTAAPPVGAVPYGVEYNFDAPNIHDQYVCRGTTVPQKVPGKGVYPYSCYFIGLDTNATEDADDTFEVLTDTASCAQMTPIATAQANGIATWLSTGTGPAGEALYSCHGTEISVDTSKPVSAPLGRYDPGSNRCLYEWMQSTKASPVGAGFSILTYL